MKLSLRILLFMALTAAALVSCDEDKKDLSDVAIFIEPSKTDTTKIGSGEKQRFTIEFHTLHDYVSILKISSFDAVRGKVELLDTSFTKKQDYYYYDFTAPAINRDSIDIILTFEAWDNAGYQCENQRVVKVRNSSHLIDEKSGIVLRASESGMSDALCFANPSQTFNWQHSPDSVNADAYIVSNEDFSEISMYSNTKAKLIRINNFDYPAATAVSVQAVYESALRDDIVRDLRVNDIILVGHDNQAEGVMMINNIIRTGTLQERCVQLSFKGISH